MHTNYDILGMADLSAGYLELSDTKVLCATGEKDGEPDVYKRQTVFWQLWSFVINPWLPCLRIWDIPFINQADGVI